jgi:hypothetical protein
MPKYWQLFTALDPNAAWHPEGLVQIYDSEEQVDPNGSVTGEGVYSPSKAKKFWYWIYTKNQIHLGRTHESPTNLLCAQNCLRSTNELCLIRSSFTGFVAWIMKVLPSILYIRATHVSLIRISINCATFLPKHTFGRPKFSVAHPSGDPHSFLFLIFKLPGLTDHLRWERHAAIKRQ